MERISGAYSGGSIFGNINLGSRMYGASAEATCKILFYINLNSLLLQIVQAVKKAN